MTFELSNYKNVDSIIIPIIDEFYRLRDSGKNDEAYKYIKQYESDLKPYSIDCESFNKIELGIWELAKEIFYNQKIIFTNLNAAEPDPDEERMNINSEWLKEYE